MPGGRTAQGGMSFLVGTFGQDLPGQDSEGNSVVGRTIEWSAPRGHAS